MEDERRQDFGPEARRNCGEHANCVYRIELLEGWRSAIDRKIDGFQKLLIANLASEIALLLSTLIGLVVYIARTH